MLFADAGGFGFERFQFAARDCERLFLVGARVSFSATACAIAVALRSERSALAAQPLQFQPGDGKPRIGAGVSSVSLRFS